MKTSLTIYIPVELRVWLEKEAKEQNKSLNMIITEILENTKDK